MIGVGVDLCAVDRMAQAIKSEHYVDRIFTQKERAHMDAQGAGRGQSAAAMFAAKEAVAKALSTGFAQGVMPGQIEVTHDASGAPGIALYGRAKARMEEMGGGHVLISLSHEGNTAIAFAVITAAKTAG